LNSTHFFGRLFIELLIYYIIFSPSHSNDTKMERDLLKLKKIILKKCVIFNRTQTIYVFFFVSVSFLLSLNLVSFWLHIFFHFVDDICLSLSLTLSLLFSVFVENQPITTVFTSNMKYLNLSFWRIIIWLVRFMHVILDLIIRLNGNIVLQ
jgi:hypothetical protein